MFYFPFFYNAILLIYFSFFDTNKRYFFLANFINTFVIGIFEIFKLTNVLFLYNFVFLIKLWIVFYLVIKKFQKNEKKPQSIQNYCEKPNKREAIEDTSDLQCAQ